MRFIVRQLLGMNRHFEKQESDFLEPNRVRWKRWYCDIFVAALSRCLYHRFG